MRATRTIRLLLAALLLALGLGGPAAAAHGVKVAVVALALWGDQGVFRSEATGAARLLAARYAATRAVVRVNTPKSFAAGPRGMAQALELADRALDPDRDVLFVVLTSHGAPQGIAEKGGGTEGLLPPQGLAELLGTAKVRRKVLIVSACFSGIYTTLASPDLLVITAADADHPSFGCTSTAKWTYFGQAFFDQALRQGTRAHAPLAEVFRTAADLVRARELKEGFEPSNPEMAGGANVLATLDADAGGAVRRSPEAGSVAAFPAVIRVYGCAVPPSLFSASSGGGASIGRAADWPGGSRIGSAE